MKMLRVVFVVSNFQEAPDGSGAAGIDGQRVCPFYANAAAAGTTTRALPQRIRTP
jgi:hypothetical protein